MYVKRRFPHSKPFLIDKKVEESRLDDPQVVAIIKTGTGAEGAGEIRRHKESCAYAFGGGERDGAVITHNEDNIKKREKSASAEKEACVAVGEETVVVGKSLLIKPPPAWEIVITSEER